MEWLVHRQLPGSPSVTELLKAGSHSGNTAWEPRNKFCFLFPSFQLPMPIILSAVLLNVQSSPVQLYPYLSTAPSLSPPFPDAYIWVIIVLLSVVASWSFYLPHVCKSMRYLCFCVWYLTAWHAVKVMSFNDWFPDMKVLDKTPDLIAGSRLGLRHKRFRRMTPDTADIA